MEPPASYAELGARSARGLAAASQRRESLGPARRSALDGAVHALRRDSMKPGIPARHLLYLDLEAPEPRAAVAVGDLDTATHVTFQLSGSGILASTALWGSSREAGQLYLAQRALGIERPAVVAWLGYRAPGLFAALSNKAAGRAAGALAADLLEFNALRPDREHLAIEAHSYGATVAAHALGILRGRAGVDMLATIGSAGCPRALAPQLPDRTFDAVAPGDWMSAWARLLGGRRLAGRRFAVDARPGRGLHAVHGHNTSQHLPGSARPRYGYRDGHTLCLENLARITTGAEPLE